MRLQVTAWEIVVWAYVVEDVRATCGSDGGAARLAEVSGTALVMEALAMGGRFRASLPGDGGGYMAPCCPDDALVVHAHVMATPGAWPLIQAAERGSPPDCNPQVPDIDRMVPVYDQNSEIVVASVLHPRTRRQTSHYCPLKWVPETARSPREKKRITDAARAEYVAFTLSLADVAARLRRGDSGLKRFAVSDLGLHPQPWTLAPLDSATKT